MKILAGIMVLFAVIYFFPAFLHMQSSHELNGKSMEQLKKSAMEVRRSMSTGDRNTFDTAFGILEKLKSEEGPDAFAKAVDGLTPEQLVELAKHEVNVRIASGHPDFRQYTSWDDMVAKLTSDGSKKVSGQPQQPAAPLRQSERTGRPN